MLRSKSLKRGSLWRREVTVSGTLDEVLRWCSSGKQEGNVKFA